MIGRTGYGGPFINYESDLDAGFLGACDFYGINHQKFLEEKETEARIAAKAEAKKARLKAQDAATTAECA